MVYLKDLDPKNPIYSHVFYTALRALTRKMKLPRPIVVPFKVYSLNGHLRVGLPPVKEDEWILHSASLHDCLAWGKPRRLYAVLSRTEPQEVEGFFEKYKELGTCVLDPQHYSYPDDHFVYKNNRRTCPRCGVKQKFYKKREVFISEYWRNI